MLITVMWRVVPIIIMNRVPVMIGKYESDRRRNADSNVYQGLDDHATPVSAAMATVMYNAPRSKDGGQKQHPYKRGDQGSSPRKG